MFDAIIGRYRRLLAPKPACFFCADWYLSHYPDVAISGIDPWLHFHYCGRREGRFACEQHIAIFFDECAVQDVLIAQAYPDSRLIPADKCYLDWLVARFHAQKGNWQAVIDLLGVSKSVERDSLFGHLPRLLYSDALCRIGNGFEVEKHLQKIKGYELEYSDMRLVAANLAQWQDEVNAWLRAINSIYAVYGFEGLGLSDDTLSLDALEGTKIAPQDGPLISVLISARNVGSVINTALSSLLDQTHRNLEIIVVDDASDDGTADVVLEWAKTDSRVRLLRHETHRGPYAARNWAMEHARGEFITVHDSDDWSHPQKLSTQVKSLLEDVKLKAALSAWTRVSDSLYCGGWDTPETWQGWVHPNISSLMIRRSVFEDIGYWDEVRCGADSEYMCRIQARWGHASTEVVAPHVPLSFGRVSTQALTRARETHLLTALRGLRNDYCRAYTAWHKAFSSQPKLYMARSPVTRPFPISSAMLLEDTPV